MNDNHYCVIMAGGIGSRFWPLSRSNKPKQFLDILGCGKTFIRSTFERFANIIPVENFLVVTNASYRDLVFKELPELDPHQVLCEPLGRNTAPCIAYAAFHIKAVNPDATMVVTPSDHLILNEQHFCEVIQQCLDFVNTNDRLLTIGLTPTRPDTGYGYIQVKNGTDDKFRQVKTFTEKPTLELAEAFLKSGEFFWNSGIFIWKVHTILESIRTFLPDTYELFNSIGRYYGTSEEQGHINRIYPECRGISVDYGIMEKASNVYVRCSDFGWSDIGTWGSLYQYNEKDENANTAADNVFAFDVKDCVLKIPKDKVAVIEGLDDYIVVDTGDVLMICPRSNEQNIKKFIETVKFNTGDRFV